MSNTINKAANYNLIMSSNNALPSYNDLFNFNGISNQGN